MGTLADNKHAYLSNILGHDGTMADLEHEFWEQLVNGTLDLSGGSTDLSAYSTTAQMNTAISAATAASMRWKGVFGTGIAYEANDVVYQASTNGTYRCRTAHTSGGAIAADGDPTYWEYLGPFNRVDSIDNLPTPVPAFRFYDAGWPARSTVTTDSTRPVVNFGGATGPTDNEAIDSWIPA